MIKNIFVMAVVYGIVAKSSAQLPDSSYRTCGKPDVGGDMMENRIVRGRSFKRGSYPWLVALMNIENPSTLEFFCGGTLISETFVISAAHCIWGKFFSEKRRTEDVVVIFGAHDLRNASDLERYQLTPKAISIHEEWRPDTYDYHADLSLLEFEAGRITFNKFVKPICLWDKGKEPNVTNGVVAGWGRSEDTSQEFQNVPTMVEVMVEPNEKCLPGAKELAGLSSLQTFCAGLKDGSGICSGDSGGGLLGKSGARYFLKGIVSASRTDANSFCIVMVHSIYTNVPKYRDWILENTRRDQPAPLELRVRSVPCTLKKTDSICCGQINTCVINQAVEDEDHELQGQGDTTIEALEISENLRVSFLPQNIGAKLPGLKELTVWRCSLSILRDHYFQNMQKLRNMDLADNQISTIEPNAFADLIGLEFLWLEYNRIQTLDENLFATMVNLKVLRLSDNNINVLSPATFNIPNGKLKIVYLGPGACVNGWYGLDRNLDDLEANIRSGCESNKEP